MSLKASAELWIVAWQRSPLVLAPSAVLQYKSRCRNCHEQQQICQRRFPLHSPSYSTPLSNAMGSRVRTCRCSARSSAAKALCLATASQTDGLVWVRTARATSPWQACRRRRADPGSNLYLQHTHRFIGVHLIATRTEYGLRLREVVLLQVVCAGVPHQSVGTSTGRGRGY